MAGTPAPPANAPQYTAAQIDAALTAAANKYGIPVAVLYAVGQTESGLNPNEPGGGMFQDIAGGEDANAAFGGNPENVYNLQDAAENAAQTIAAARQANPRATWGQIAAAAQKPKDPAAYASTVNSYLTEPTSQIAAPSAPIPATLTADVRTMAPNTTAPATANPSVVAGVGETGTAPSAEAVTGSGVTNYKGFDLAAIPANMVKQAETSIDEYISKPGYAAQLNQRIAQDFGYSGGWIEKIPELYGLLVWASSNLDPSSQTDQNLFLGSLENTSWWKSTDQNQRAWQEAQSQDPATAQNALVEAEDHVIATANQVGVTLSKTQTQQIAEVYAAQSYTPTGVLGSASGTSQDWLDQAVIDSAENVKNTGAVTGNGTAVNENYSGGTPDITATTNPTALSGIAQQLYTAFQGVAQNYLLYDSNNPNASLLSTQDIMKDVNQALLGYTGTGASGLASEFVNNATAQFTQQAMAQASSVYPTLSTVIQQGTTPSSYITPLTNYVASSLGMSQGQVNVMDPQWNWLISTAGQNGVKGPVTQDQALQKITSPNFSWTDPNGQQMNYMQTNAGQQIQNQFAQQFASAFGKSA